MRFKKRGISHQPHNRQTGHQAAPSLKKTKYVKDKRETLEFQIAVRLVSNTDGQVIFTLLNERPLGIYTTDIPGIHPANLDDFRMYVLAQMARDLEKAIREARE